MSEHPWPDPEANRIWAAIALCRYVDDCEAVLAGEPVIAAHLDAECLRRGLRGKPFPPASEFITVSGEMLDAIAAAGPLRMKEKDGRS